MLIFAWPRPAYLWPNRAINSARVAPAAAASTAPECRRSCHRRSSRPAAARASPDSPCTTLWPATSAPGRRRKGTAVRRRRGRCGSTRWSQNGRQVRWDRDVAHAGRRFSGCRIAAGRRPGPRPAGADHAGIEVDVPQLAGVRVSPSRIASQDAHVTASCSRVGHLGR